MRLPPNFPQRKPLLFTWVAEHRRSGGDEQLSVWLTLTPGDRQATWPGGQSGPASAQEEGSSHLNSPHTRSVRHQPPPGVTSQVPERKSRPLCMTESPPQLPDQKMRTSYKRKGQEEATKTVSNYKNSKPKSIIHPWRHCRDSWNHQVFGCG